MKQQVSNVILVKPVKHLLKAKPPLNRPESISIHNISKKALEEQSYKTVQVQDLYQLNERPQERALKNRKMSQASVNAKPQ